MWSFAIAEETTVAPPFLDRQFLLKGGEDVKDLRLSL